MKKISTILSILFLVSLASMTFAIKVTEPVIREVNADDVIDLGQIGPGQTISIRLEPHVSEGGKFGQGGDYDLAVPMNLPDGWEGKQSKLYERPLDVGITAAKDASEGEYIVKISVQDTNDDKLNNVTFAVKIKITWNILDMTVSPEAISVGPGQPARYEISITNKGTASDVFEVSSSGLKRWQYKKYVYVSAKSTKVVNYELVENEEETYNPIISVVSQASGIIKQEKQVGFQVKTNLRSDYKATNHGVLILPTFESIVYSFMGLLSNFV